MVDPSHITSDSTSEETTDRSLNGSRAVQLRAVKFFLLCASLCLPGLGHLFAGKFVRAAFWFTLTLLLYGIQLFTSSIPNLLPTTLAVAVITLGATIWMYIDSRRYAKNFTSSKLANPSISFLLGMLLLAIAGVVSPAKLTASFMKSHLFEAFTVGSQSMSPTLVTSDHIVVHKQVMPQRWDIIAFNSPQTRQTQCARLVGLPGEKIEIVNGIVQVNDQPQAAPSGLGLYTIPSYALSAIGGKGDPITLGPDEYYVLGDNSTVAFDSRFWQNTVPGHQRGTLPRTSIIGVATWIYWPVNDWKKLH